MYLNSKCYKFLELALSILVYFVAFFIITTVIWLKKEFGEVTIDQILYHLQYGAEGLADADQEIIKAFINKCLIRSLFFAVITAVLMHDLRKNLIAWIKKSKEFLVSFFMQNRLGHKFFSIRPQYLLLSAAVIYSLVKFSVFSYAWDNLLPNSKDFYAENYISPKQAKLTTVGIPRNLLLIYVESLESTYDNKEIFRENLVHSISTETLGGISFNKQRQIPGTGWTMAGIVSTQCGIPLRPSFGGGGNRTNNTSTEGKKAFLPNIICLGDILKEKGYKNIFMGGASLEFAGKGNFFKSHGYQETYGRDEFDKVSTGRLAQNHWGIFDDVLLDEARKKIDFLEKSQQPYNLTLLTLDTHGPGGSFSQTCLKRGAVKFPDIVRCTSDMLSELVTYMENQGYLEHTTVVIMGDHLIMENTVSKKIQKISERFIFNTYVVRNMDLVKKRDEILHVDHLPTILDSMNIKVEAGKIGLGISGFYDEKNMNPQQRFDLLNAFATKSSDKYLSFWTPKD